MGGKTAAMQVRLCGTFGITIDGQPVDASRLPGRQGRLVLAYLLCSPSRVVSRDELAELLWSDELPGSWTASLSAVVSKLRRLVDDLGLDAARTIVSTPGGYRLDLPGHVTVDWIDARRALADAEEALIDQDLRRAIDEATTAARIVRSGFLPETCRWVDGETHKVHDVQVRAQLVLAEAQLDAGSPARAVEAARHALELDPTRESGFRLLMRALEATGERGEALRTWERCRATLVDELGVDPSPETEAVYLGLLEGAPPQRRLASTGVTRPRSGRLPVEMTRFIGRAAELDALAAAVTGTAMVTITGVGGVGKTRSAIEVARRLMDSFRDEVRLVELAGVASEDAVIDAVSTAVGFSAAMSGASDLPEFMADREMLVVVDNCEHLLGATADLIESILAVAPGVHVLATSREPLGVTGEQIRGLPCMTVPVSGDDRCSIASADAIVLFVERARDVDASFELGEDAVVVAELCRRLDGIPLAIELAAARTSSMTPTEIVAHLDHRLKLLTGGRRAAQNRQRTLRAAIEWSYQLLETDEQELFDRLAVFVDGFDLDAATAVAGSVDAVVSLDVLSRLVSKSLVIAERDGTATRYRLLETIREYAWDHLDSACTLHELGGRHARHYAAFAHDAATAMRGPDEKHWRSRVDAERGTSVRRSRGPSPPTSPISPSNRSPTSPSPATTRRPSVRCPCRRPRPSPTTGWLPWRWARPRGLRLSATTTSRLSDSPSVHWRRSTSSIRRCRSVARSTTPRAWPSSPPDATSSPSGRDGSMMPARSGTPGSSSRPSPSGSSPSTTSTKRSPWVKKPSRWPRSSVSPATSRSTRRRWLLVSASGIPTALTSFSRSPSP